MEAASHGLVTIFNPFILECLLDLIGSLGMVLGMIAPGMRGIFLNGFIFCGFLGL